MKKTIILITVFLFLALVGLSAWVTIEINRQFYLEPRVEFIKIVEINGKDHILIGTETAGIEKTFPTAYLLVTEEMKDDDVNEINLTIVAKYACISRDSRAVLSPAIVFAEDFFTTEHTRITIGRSRRHLATVRKMNHHGTTKLSCGD